MMIYVKFSVIYLICLYNPQEATVKDSNVSSYPLWAFGLSINVSLQMDKVSFEKVIWK